MSATGLAVPEQPAAPVRADKASAAEWMAVTAGSLGSFMASLDISIVNSSLPTIQGEIGASASEGTWVATAYLVAEIVIIPLTGWFERMLGLRRFLLGAAILFTGFSVMCGMAGDLTTMIIGRVGQGLTGGAMIPTAMIIIATRLPPRQQPIGTAAFGSTVLVAPILGPILGGWLTENFSWHYAFFINVPICAVLVALLMLGLRPARANLAEIFEADWAGVLGMILGLGALTVVLEEGHREQWYESSLITNLTLVSLLGFVLIGWGQFRAKRPVIHLRILRKPDFAGIVVMSFVGGMVLLSLPYITPQFLVAVAGYNPFQAGQVVLIFGVPPLILMPMVPLMLPHVNIRWATAGGFAFVAAGCFINSRLSPDTAGPQFVWPQLIMGGGMLIAMAMLNQASITSGGAKDAADASGLFNASRNLGGAFGLAILATMRDHQLDVHQWEIFSTLSANDIDLQSRLSAAANALGGGQEGLTAAYRMLETRVAHDALVMAFADNFFLMGAATVLILPLTLLLQPLPDDFEMSLH